MPAAKTKFLKNAFLTASASLIQCIPPLTAVALAKSFGFDNSIHGGLAVAAAGASLSGAIAAMIVRNPDSYNQAVIEINKGSVAGAGIALSLITTAGFTAQTLG